MRRVLFIAYLYPPIVNSGTRRSICFANHLPDHGWQPVVLTAQDPPREPLDMSLFNDVREGTVIERAPMGSVQAARFVSRVLAPPSWRKRVEEGLEWRIEAMLSIPDSIALWYPYAVRRGVELHRESGFDLIYASGWPWTSFLVARAISMRTGCPYVIDYRDLWKSPGEVAWEQHTWTQRVLGARLESKAMRDASAIVTVTRTLAESLREKAKAVPVHCITNGFEPEDFEVPVEDDARIADGEAPSNVFRIAFTGVWRPGYGPDGLYGAIRMLKAKGAAALSRLRVVAAGFKPGPAREYGIDDVVEELGRIPHAQAVDLMKRADALFLPVSEGYYAKASLPGKLFEYMGSRRPIITTAPADSEVARVLSDVGGALCVEPDDEAALARLLEEVCREGGADRFPQARPDRLARYTRASTTQRLAMVFDSVQRGVPLEPLA